MSKETWEPIKGYEGFYAISSKGRVKSFHNNKDGKILKLSITKFGYNRLELNLRGNAKKYPVHRLVAIAFIDNPDNKREVNHIDGNKLNNCVKNLEWVSPSENQLHAFEIGLQTSRSGENHHNSKLTKQQVIDIRELYKSGNYKQVKLAEMYGVHSRYINLIIKRRRWKNV